MMRMLLKSWRTSLSYLLIIPFVSEFEVFPFCIYSLIILNFLWAGIHVMAEVDVPGHAESWYSLLNINFCLKLVLFTILDD